MFPECRAMNHRLNCITNFYHDLRQANDEMNRVFVTAVFFILCVSAFVTEGLGVHAFFGGFAFGIMVR